MNAGFRFVVYCFVHLCHALGVPIRLRRYPHDLMQIMLPKGKVTEKTYILLSVPCQISPHLKLRTSFSTRYGMELLVNEQLQQVPVACTIQGLMDMLLPDQQKGVAVAINQTVVARNQWETYVLAPSDKVLLIKATQGG